MIKSALARLLTLKAVLAAAGIAVGGVALAAGTGHLPAQLGGAPSAAHATQRPSQAAASATAGASHAANHPNATPSPSLRGLCHAFTASVGTNPGKALANPAFSALITAAGGKDKVTTFCATLLGSKPGATPAAHSTGKPSTLPNSRSTARPSRTPHPHPTGKSSTGAAA